MKVWNFLILAIALFYLPLPFAHVVTAHAKGVDLEEKVEYYLYDYLGGVDAVLDEQGNVVEHRDYLPYGEERVNATGNERHGFTGKELDGESGLYYYGARYYDSAIGRFTSVDPWDGDLRNPQSFNKFGYAFNNPLRYIDPTGMLTKDGVTEKGDNLTKVSRQIKEYTGADLSVKDIASANGIKDINKIYVGQKIKMPGEDLYLKFNNKFLQAFDKAYDFAYDTLKWKGVSGGTLLNFDPIPEGEWEVDPKKTQNYDSDVNTIENFGNQISKLTRFIGVKFGPWPGGETSWGNSRTELKNLSTGVDKTGYYIHGGRDPGSAGCIDLTGANDSFQKWLTGQSRPIEVLVDYSDK